VSPKTNTTAALRLGAFTQGHTQVCLLWHSPAVLANPKGLIPIPQATHAPELRQSGLRPMYSRTSTLLLGSNLDQAEVGS